VNGLKLHGVCSSTTYRNKADDMKTFPTRFVSALALLAGSTASAADLTPVGLNKQLLVDD
jgi:hypothetical protein